MFLLKEPIDRPEAWAFPVGLLLTALTGPRGAPVISTPSPTLPAALPVSTVYMPREVKGHCESRVKNNFMTSVINIQYELELAHSDQLSEVNRNKVHRMRFRPAWMENKGIVICQGHKFTF